MKESPCRLCTNHNEICHGICNKYKEWEEEHSRERSKINHAKAHERMLDRPKRDFMNKVRRAKK